MAIIQDAITSLMGAILQMTGKANYGHVLSVAFPLPLLARRGVMVADRLYTNTPTGIQRG